MSFWRPNPSSEDGDTFTLKALTPACVGTTEHQFFMGGVGMAAAICALEQWTDKPLLWCTIQFINHGMLGDDFSLELTRVGGGRRVVQTMARLKRGEEILQQSISALGARDTETDHQFSVMPKVPPAEDCALKSDNAFNQSGNLIDQFERRTALEDNEAGLECMWIKPKFEASMSAPMLALMSDFFLGAHPLTRGGTSLDNTFRLCALQPTEWVLAVTQLSRFRDGAAHGTQQQFAQDGTLLSISSQTGLIPRPPSDTAQA